MILKAAIKPQLSCLVMFKRVFLTLCLLISCTGVSSVPDRPQEVLVLAGSDVTLPCSFNINPDDDPPTVEWSRDGLHPNVVFLYRDGCETFEMKNEDYEYRTSLVINHLQDGNASLKILNVRISDAGVYTCKILQNAKPFSKTVTLVVVAVSEPKLRVVSPESGGVTVECETGCWMPEPEVTFQDDEGRDIPAGEPKIEPTGSSCFSVKRGVTLQKYTPRVTCRVHQSKWNQTREAEIFIPADCMRSLSLNIGASIGGTLIFSLVVFGIGFIVWKKCGKPAKSKEQVSRTVSNERATSEDNKDDDPLLTKGGGRDSKAATIKRQNKEVADLKAENRRKDETIRKLEETIQNLQRDLKSHHVVCQQNQPTLDPSPSTKTAPQLPPNHKPPATTTSPPATTSNGVQTNKPKPTVPKPNPSSGKSQKLHRNYSNPVLPSCRSSAPSSFPPPTNNNTTGNHLGRHTRSFSMSSSSQTVPNLTPVQRIALSPTLFNPYSPLANLKEE